MIANIKIHATQITDFELFTTNFRQTTSKKHLTTLFRRLKTTQ